MLSRPAKLALFILLLAGVSACNKNTPVSDSPARAHSATLRWTASTSRVAGYRIYRSSDAQTPPGLLAVTAANDTQYVDKSVEGSKTYYYSVKAFDAAGRESVAATISATIPADSAK